MIVILTQAAINRLEEIVAFYEECGYLNFGIKTRKKLIQKAMTLQHFPMMGQIEEQLSSLEEAHRYLVEGNHKIIYKVKNNIIYITDIFDTRQDPEKM